LIMPFERTHYEQASVMVEDFRGAAQGELQAAQIHALLAINESLETINENLSALSGAVQAMRWMFEKELKDAV
jgi:hypothetical protein